VEPCKQYRSTVEFNFIDATALINVGDPCKRALSERPQTHALDCAATGMGEENINRNEYVDSNHRTAVVNAVMSLRFP
jgi:hypothetical protein